MTTERRPPDDGNPDEPDWAKVIRRTLEHDGDPLYDNLRSSLGLVQDDVSR